MKLATWNVNGIRSLKKPLSQIFRELDADIICFQETKITRDQLDETLAFVDGYSSYFSFSTVKSGYSGVATFCRDAMRPVRAQEGLTGLLADRDACCNGARVATPTASIWCCTEADVGMWAWQSAADQLAEANTATAVSDPASLLRQLDAEGRAVITQHVISSAPAGEAAGAAIAENGNNKLLTVINVYCPCVNPERKDDRESFRLHFLGLLGTVVRGLVASGSAVIVAGDLNVAHKPIDHCDPGDVKEFENRPACKWANALLLQPNATAICNDGADQSPSHSEATSTTTVAATPRTVADDSNSASSTAVLVDAFRHLHPTASEGGYTCWSSSTGARRTNYGTRIDYVLVSPDVARSLIACHTLQDYDGSDHCPVVADCGGGGGLQLLPASELPPACAAFLTKFKAKQSKLSSFVLRGATAAAAAVVAPLGTASGQPAQILGRPGLSQPEAGKRGQQGLQPALRAGKVGPRKRCFAGPAGRDFAQSTLPASFSKKASSSSSDSTPAGDRTCGTPSSFKLTDGTRAMLQAAANEEAAPTSTHVGLAQAPETGLSDRPAHGRAGGCGASAAGTTDDRCAEVAAMAEADDVAAAASTGNGRGLDAAWRSLFKPRAAPVCKGHSERCTMHTVKKEGPNRGRQFYVCARPVGRPDNPLSRCSHFEWACGPKR